MIIPSLSLPLVDISPFLAANTCSAEQQEALAQAKAASAQVMNEACRNVGFFYLIGHGVDESELKRVRDLAQDFFHRPEEVKQAISILNGDLARGYQRLGQNVTQYQNDWHEGLDLYAPVNPEDKDHTLHKRGIKTLAGENQWPSQPAEFKEVFTEYVEKMKVRSLCV